MFSTWCLRNFLFGLMIIALILSVLQVILIFMNNMIFGAVLMVSYIIFFQVVIFALCRDSITLFFATIVFLFIFVIGCICIQSTKTDVTQVFVYNEDGGKTSLLARSFVGLNSECCDVDGAFYNGSNVELLSKCCHNDKTLGDPLSKHCQEMNFGRYFFSKGCPKFQVYRRDREIYDRLNADADELLERRKDVLASSDDDDEDIRSGRQETPAPAADEGGGGGGGGGEGGEGESKPKKRARFLNELRWISNVLGIMHILMIALIFCYLYELLFGYCDHPYTYC